MDKRSIILIWVFVGMIAVSVFLTYKRSFVDQNFIITQEEEGDPEETDTTEEESDQEL